MSEATDPPPVPACTRVYVLAPWIISAISAPVALIALAFRAGGSAFFLTSYGLLMLAIGVPAGIVSARVAYVAAVHAGGCNGRRVAARYFLCAILLVAAAMAVMLPVLG
ncbi:MAG: hypothetical protein NCW75_01150 [Phycisphaera sp.]|nr:MAG: hypothetical protein NCW75_01150 [Phycisphaera sp.]